MPNRLDNLKQKAASASTAKGPLLLPKDVSFELRETLLEIHKVAMRAFDCLEADAVSQQDIFTILQLPDLVNKFSLKLQEHAKEMVAKKH